MKALVTYATAHGSTEEIARRIADRLRGHGLDVDVVPVCCASTLADYDAMVVGSAIHDQAWLPEAARFVRENAATLVSRPVWLFSVGLTDALPRWLSRRARAEGPKAIAQVAAGLRPRSTRLFSGCLRPEHLPRLGRVLYRLLGGRYGNFQDWEAIDAWADDIARAHRAAAESPADRIEKRLLPCPP